MLNTPYLRNKYRTERINTITSNNWIGRIIAILCLLLIIMATLSIYTAKASDGHLNAINDHNKLYAGYTLDQWADAIKHAENNENYGILVHYKNTSYRQACKNTIKHKYTQWDHKGLFIHYLASKYAPVGAGNDPDGLNKNWECNVNYWLVKGNNDKI